MPLVKIDGINTLVRDTTSMALLNTNDNERNEYFSKVRMMHTQKESLNKVKEEIDDIRSDVTEIKNMLSQLLSKQ